MLQGSIKKTPGNYMLLVIGDLNAKVGTDREGREQAICTKGIEERNMNREKLLDLYLNHNLVIGGTQFPHKSILKLTWISPNGRTSNQIDQLMIKRKKRGSMQDVKVHRGADVASDHPLVVTKIKLKLRKAIKPSSNERNRLFDVGKLNNARVKKEFVLELTNRFHVLERLKRMGKKVWRRRTSKPSGTTSNQS